MKYRIKQFFRNIHNLIRWFPIIWKDRDWDHHFIFEILKFKLKNQAEYIGKRGNHLSAKRDAEIMMTCVRLIEKIQDEYYASEYFEYYKSYLEFKKLENSELFEITETVTSEALEDYFKKYPLIYRLVPDLNAPKSRIAFQMAKINQERAHKLLFKILEENIQRWWD
jgi:hypothetical protein